MDATQDLSTSHDLIKDCTKEQWEDFEEHIEMLKPEDQAAIADRLGAAEQQDWQDYAKVFSDYEWYQFIEAYHHATYRNWPE